MLRPRGFWVTNGVLLGLDDVVEKLPSLHVLHDEKKLFGGLDDLIKLNDAGMADEFQDVDFAGDSLDVGNIDDFLLLQDLDCHFLARLDMRGGFYFAECALAEGFPQHICTDCFSMGRVQLLGA